MKNQPKSQTNTMISIVIPAFNEGELIAKTIRGLFAYLDDHFSSAEIILVDDGSTDETAVLAQKEFPRTNPQITLALLQNQKNKGKGYAIQRGMFAAKGEVCIFMDADSPFELDALSFIADLIQASNPIVVGARDLPGSTLVNVPFMRFLAGQLFSVLVQLFAVKGIRDTQCGLKGFCAKAVKEIFPLITLHDFAFDVELLFIAQRLGYEIKRIPVRMTGFRGDSRVNLLKDSLIMFFDLFKIRINAMRGLYRLRN